MRGHLPGGDIGKANKERSSDRSPRTEEQKMLFGRSYTCPVCESEFASPSVMAGKVISGGTDIDLRAKYKNIEPLKYRPVECPKCGYAALDVYFPIISKTGLSAVRENLTAPVMKEPVLTRTYGEAFHIYHSALRYTLIKSSQSSERGMVSLSMAWLIRSWRESLPEGNEIQGDIRVTYDTEIKYLKYAHRYLLLAREKERFPIAGMETPNFDYLLAALCHELGDDREAARLINGVLLNRKIPRQLRETAEDLRDII